MKINNTIKHLIILAFTIVMGFVACKKDEPFPPSPLPNGDVHLHIRAIADTNILANYDSIYTLSTGRKISVSTAKLYISEMQLVKAEGGTYDVPGTFLFDSFDAEFVLGEAPPVKYNAIKFNVGLSATDNASSPVTAADSLLYPSDMWFDVTPQPSGYVFLNLQGKIDTTTNADGNVIDMQPFTYKIGTNANLQAVTITDMDYSVLPKWRFSTPLTINLVVDYGKLFEGVVLNNTINLQVNTTSDNTNPIAAQIRDNIPLMFSYE